MNISYKTKASFTVQLEITGGEAKALDALVGYGFKEFLDFFYKSLGRHYLEPYENDLKTLFENIKTNVVPEVNRIEKCEKAFHDSVNKKD